MGFPRATPNSRWRLAAEMYLDAGGNGHHGRLSLKQCADHFGIKIAAVHAAVVIVREERRLAAIAALAWPEDECTL